jgi:hypothetical protein
VTEVPPALGIWDAEAILSSLRVPAHRHVATWWRGESPPLHQMLRSQGSPKNSVQSQSLVTCFGAAASAGARIAEIGPPFEAVGSHLQRGPGDQ